MEAEEPRGADGSKHEVRVCAPCPPRGAASRRTCSEPREAQAPLSAPLSLSYIHLRRQDVTEERNLARRRPRHSGRHKRGRSAERRAPAGFTKGKRPPPPILFLPVSPQKGEAVCCTLCAPRRHFGQRELNFLSFRLSEGQEARRSCRMSLPRLSLCPLP